MKISVVFVTNRPNCMYLLREQLDKQDFRDFEVIVADDLHAQRRNSTKLILKNYRLTHFQPRPKQAGEVWNLNKAYNDAIVRSQGELLVFLQDFITIQPIGFSRFWELHEQKPTALICGENKYESTLPDPRILGSKEQLVPTTAWTTNWGSCTRALMPRFEEDMDTVYGGDEVIVAYKAHLQDREMFVDRLNPCVNLSRQQKPDDWNLHPERLVGKVNSKMRELEQHYLATSRQARLRFLRKV